MIYYEIRNLYEENYPKETLITFLKNKNLEYYGILHNKDIFPTGEIKKPHFHLIVGVDKDSKIAKTYLTTLFNDEALYFQNVRSLPHFIRYLTHKDNLEKYQYSDSEVFTSDISKYEELSTKAIKTSKTDELLDELYKYMLQYDFSQNRTEIDIFIWFKDRKKLDYYIRNKRNIDNMIDTIKPYILCDSALKGE